ncbi:MAG: Pvc16 family protein [Polyangia bacterium]
MSLFRYLHPRWPLAELAAALPGSDLDKATDLVRLVPHLMPNEEMVRLWGTFQVKYRLSVAYRASTGFD